MKIEVFATEVRAEQAVSDRRSLTEAEFACVAGDNRRAHIQDHPIPGLGRDIRLNATVELPDGNMSVKLTSGASTLRGANVIFVAMCHYGGVRPYFLTADGTHILEMFCKE